MTQKSTALRAPNRFSPISRYFPIGAEHRLLGLHVFNVGTSSVDPGHPYPLVRNPAGKMIDWSKGRMLPFPKLLFVTRGSGSVETRDAQHPVTAGDLLLLLPGTWYHYHPDPTTGWDETWFKFDGSLTRKLLNRQELASSGPILHVGRDREIISLFDEMVLLAREEPAGFELLLASKAIEVLTRVLIGNHRRKVGEDHFEAILREAKERLLEDGGRIPLQDLARELGMSYSTFRRAFKDRTRISPHQFQLQSRIHQSCVLLTETRLPVKEIADRQGFESVSYFSQIFKRKTGWSPQDYRKNFSSALLPGA